ncbi:MAG: 16S rRNA (guanine(527)-N(7))-methyltransferase RsmG [Steroidobacteraceae bacterium]
MYKTDSMTDNQLQTAAQAFGLTLDMAQCLALERLLLELNEWNQRMNLTAIRDPEQQVTKHLLDSLSIHPYLRGAHIADIGTGAGFPGLPLALVNPDKQFVLIDSVNKKLRFVEHAAQAMGLHNVAVLHIRAQDYRPERRFDCVVSRAMGSIENFVNWCGHLCSSGGRLLAMKGRYPEGELRSLPNGWKAAAIHVLKVPGLDEQRHLVEICRSHDKV